MPVDREVEGRLAALRREFGSQLAYTERRVRSMRNRAFVSDFLGADIGELGAVDTFLDFREVAVPDNPDTGYRRVFANTATNKLSVRTSGGVTINLEYGDTEAIAAVEGEATLDLTGEVTIASGKSLTLKTDGATGGLKLGAGGDVILYRGAANRLDLGTGDSLRLVSGTLETDLIAEVTGAAGVTVDGVLLKDGVVAVGDVAFDDATSDPLIDADAAADGTENSVARKDHQHIKHHVAFVQADADALYDALGGLAAHVALFDATTFLYATDDDDPQPKTPTEVMAILSAAAGAAFDWGGQDLANLGVLFLTEQAAAEADIAGKGQIWVKTGAPNTLWFTDENGADHQLGLGATHALLDGATHSDTVADAVTRGSLVYGNATPKWDELVVGAAGTVLASDGADPSWTGSPALSGTLTVDAVNEYTGGAGVTFEGVKALDSFLELSEIAIPSAPAAGKGRLLAPLLTTNDSLTAGTDETGLFYRRNDGLMVKVSDDFPYSQKRRYVSQDDEPDFENSWANFGTGQRQASFVKDFLGCVWVTGLVKSGTIGANDVFTMPEGYWNTGGSLMWATIANGALGRFDLVSGSPQAAAGSNVNFSLARMAFPETNRITWHAVGGGGGEPAFENSWVNFGGAWDVAGFAKDAIGRVWVKGLVKGGGDATAVFTLPAGYRPTADIYLPILTNAGVIGRMDITAAGLVKVDLLGAGTNAYATINCVFQADGAITWHEVGSGGGEPAFLSNWVNFGGAWGTAAFCKDACGVVHVKGMVKDGDARPSIVFTLPVGYRPRSVEVAISLSGDAIGQMNVTPSGQVYAFAGANSSFSLHFAFVAEQ